jgi:phosphoglucosamine mutase
MGQRKLFGTDGIRGKANIYPMTPEMAMALGRAVTHYFQKISKSKKPLIIIGKDTRLSCYMLEQAFASGVCSQGGRAILTGPFPTPAVAFVTHSMRADASVMISASHNPYSDNGIKIFDRHGDKLPDETEKELEEMVLNPHLIPKKLDDQLGNAKRLDEVLGRYIVHVKSAYNEERTLEGMRLVVDGANGAAYRIAPMVFEELGAEVIAMGNQPNGTNINTNIGALHPEACAEAVVKYRADLGICLDGDADRLVVVDGNGDVVNGDKLIGVFGKYLKDTGKLCKNNEVVGTVMSNIGVEKFLSQNGISFSRTKVGDRYILERMKQSGALFGGEPSGHLVFREFSTTGDGILAALKMIEMTQYYGKTIKELTDQIDLAPQVLKNVTVKEKKPFDQIPEVSSKIKEIETDMGNDGRVLLRYSGTEMLARVMAEGIDEKKVNKACDELASVIEKTLN